MAWGQTRGLPLITGTGEQVVLSNLFLTKHLKRGKAGALRTSLGKSIPLKVGWNLAKLPLGYETSTANLILNPSVGPLGSFPMAVVINDHRTSSLTQQKCLLSQFRKSEVQISLVWPQIKVRTGPHSLQRSVERFLSWFFQLLVPASFSWLVATSLQPPALSSHCSLLCVFLSSPSCKDNCMHVGPTHRI